MTFGESLGIGLGFRTALALGLAVSMAGTFLVMPRAMRKLTGARITGRDRHKAGAPEIPEMGGLAVFVAFNLGAFVTLAFGNVSADQQALILAGLVVAAGACITGILDDLISLRQRFKALIPVGFAIPLVLYLPDFRISVPMVGPVDFDVFYPLVLVPLGIACASNGFNMLEGFNGLGAGLGIILAAAISALAILNGNLTGLALLLPLLGALGGFLWFNFYPAKIFPGDTMTLLVGAVLATAAMLSKVEFWAALLFIPHIVEFFLKAGGGFNAQSFATHLEGDKLRYEGPTQSLTHVVMRHMDVTESLLVVRFWMMEALVAIIVVGLFMVTQR